MATANTDQQGRFRLQLPAATYTIRATDARGLHSTTQQAVTVTVDHRVSLTLTVDSGIR